MSIVLSFPSSGRRKVWATVVAIMFISTALGARSLGGLLGALLGAALIYYAPIKIWGAIQKRAA